MLQVYYLNYQFSKQNQNQIPIPFTFSSKNNRFSNMKHQTKFCLQKVVVAEVFFIWCPNSISGTFWKTGERYWNLVSFWKSIVEIIHLYSLPLPRRIAHRVVAESMGGNRYFLIIMLPYFFDIFLLSSAFLFLYTSIALGSLELPIW